MKGVPSTSSGLYYIETNEMKIGGSNEAQIAPRPLERFGFVKTAGIAARLDGSTRKPVKLAAGELFFLPAGRAMFARSLSTSDAIVAFVVFLADHNEDWASRRSERDIAVFRMPQMKNWLDEFRSRDGESPLPEYYQLQSRLYALASAFFEIRPQPKPEDTEMIAYVEQVRRRILEHYEAPLDMEELARGSGAGPSRFYRSFRKITGISPLQYLIGTRLGASLRLLADPSVGVAEAAHSVGYPDEYYFSRLFKKQMGIAPTEYASRAQISLAVLSPIFLGDLAVFGISPAVSLRRGWHEDADRLDAYLAEIGQARPELILTGPVPDTLRGRLEAIGPVEAIDWKRQPWKSRLIRIAGLLRLETVAERWLSEFDRKTANARELVAERWPDRSCLIVGVRAGNFRVYGKRGQKLAGVLYGELSFKAPPAAEEFGFADYDQVERLPKLGEDFALFIVEFPAEAAFCAELERRWRESAEKPCVLIRLDEPFNYNAEMHERLIDCIVLHMNAEYRSK
ncbi:helix-turn-helix domain-containing protein [Paenibacillaceae bacterium WGS1546]|uniref:helix-turn-helix domain-containing protein n=1 Tax=Cohnella sp. WGS1546 TaxID=3366810 RepID=UPI00372D22F4